MNFKSFNIHRFDNSRHITGGIRGFTAVIDPADGHLVRVRMSLCNHKDMFCKKEGAKNAVESPVYDFTCNARHFLKEIDGKLCERTVSINHHVGSSVTWFGVEEGEYLFKYLF
jgi:hypothetical protein